MRAVFLATILPVLPVVVLIGSRAGGSASSEDSYECTIVAAYDLAVDGTLRPQGAGLDSRGGRFTVSRESGQIIGEWLPTLMASRVEVLRRGDTAWAFESISTYPTPAGSSGQLIHIEHFREGPAKSFVAAAPSGAGIVTGVCTLR